MSAVQGSAAGNYDSSEIIFAAITPILSLNKSMNLPRNASEKGIVSV
jgi:hypothetical protein